MRAYYTLVVRGSSTFTIRYAVHACPVLCCVGISKQLEATLGMAKSFVGTAAYMAPERVKG